MLQPLRTPERFGDVELSVQASRTHYCTPRVDGLDLDQYETVEIALFGPEVTEQFMRLLGRNMKSNMCRPSDVGIDGFDHLFEDGFNPVAGYVPRAEVERLRQALRGRLKARGEAS